MKESYAWGVREYSHYQGSTPGPVLAAFATKAEAQAVEDKVSTCSFCNPGRAGNYSTGYCLQVVKTSKPAGFVHEECPDEIVEASTGLAV